MKIKTKLIIILIIVILLCVIGYFARKVIIFNNYRLAQEKFSKIDNFYIRTVEENGMTDTFRGANKALIMNYNKYGSDTMIYTDEKESTTYSTFDLGPMGVQKTAMVSPRYQDDDMLPILTDDSFVLKDFSEAFKAAFKYKISNVNVDAFKCYEFKIDDHFSIYVNRKDYFKIREDNYSLVNTVTEYSIGSVTDEEIMKPSLEGFQIVNRDEKN